MLIDSAKRGTIGLILEKRTFEEQLATCATSIAVSPTQRQSFNHFLLAKIGVDQTSNLSLSLLCTQLRVHHFARSQPFSQSLFKRALSRHCGRTNGFHL